MFIRGSGLGISQGEYGFLRGLVVKNNDPLKLNRVKVFIPELSNQPYSEWFEKYNNINIRTPGKNIPTDNFSDDKIFEEICQNIPWASPCFPLLGEGSNSRYFAEDGTATTSDCNYKEGFDVIDNKSLTLSSGSFSPAFLYDNFGTVLGDAFNNPLGNYSGKCNPYSFGTSPHKHVNKTKGAIGIPNVGTKVWVFHDQGDYLNPVYFGVIHDYRELGQLNNTDNASNVGQTYPSNFENIP